jgi:redox-sensitive bicupin YhaK (pirin superfamily)
MNILSRDTLELEGFAGITEYRLLTDSRLFGNKKKPEASEGFGSLVYIADAEYHPAGESGMHSHSEIDVISVIIKGRVDHDGSMEQGRNLVAGDVQVQRAGGEGFSHNEKNPDNDRNRMLQVWTLPEIAGQPAAYKFYTPKLAGVTRIYGGIESQAETFASNTLIDIVHLAAGESITLNGEQLTYVIAGEAAISEVKNSDANNIHKIKDGDLIRSSDVEITAIENLHMLVVSQQP